MATGGERRAGGGGGILSPLRLPLFRAIWLANLVGSVGWLVQGVGAAWLMTTLAGTPDMVALVQSATLAPILLFALFAGALADLWDRRWVLLLAQLWVAAASFGLAAVGAAGLLTPGEPAAVHLPGRHGCCAQRPGLAGGGARDRAARASWRRR